MFNLKKYLLWLPRFHSRRNKIVLIAAAILSAVLLLTAIFYFNIYPYRDSLIDKTPADSVVYIHFNLPRSVPLEAGLVRGLPDGVADYQRLNLRPLFSSLDQWFNWPAGQFEKNILPLAGKEISFAAVPWRNEKNELNLAPVLLIDLNRQSRSAISSAQLEALGLFFTFLNKRQLAIADSAATLAKITGVTKETNLKNQAMVKNGLARFNGQSLVKGYLAVEPLAEHYNQSPAVADLSFLLTRLSADFLLQQNNRQIYFAVKKVGADFNFNLIGSADNFVFQPAVARDKLIKFIPPNATLVLSGFNWQELVAQLEKGLQTAGSGLADFKTDYEKSYRFDWPADLAPLLSGPGDLIIVKDGQQNKFILTVKLPAAPADKLNKLKEIVKEYLAYRRPMEKIRVLPDKSRVAELIADPDRFNWQEAESDGLKIDFITEPGLGFEFLYTFLGGRLVFSNSLEQFKSFLRQQKEPGPDWLNFDQVTRQPFLIKSNEAVLLNLRALGLNHFFRELLANFNYLTIMNTRSGILGNIY